MNDDNQHNNLDHFLRSRLLKGDGDVSWNVPSNDVFHRAMVSIQKEKKQRAGWIWWLVLFSLLALGLFYVLWSQNQIKSLSGKVDQLHQKLQSQTGHTNTSEKEVPIYSNSQNTKPINNIELSQKISKNARPKYLWRSRALTSENPRVESKDKELELNHARLVPDNLLLQKKFEMEKTDSNQIVALKDNKEEPSSMDTSKFHSTSQESSAFLHKWYTFSGLNWTSLSMSAVNPLPNNLTQYDNWYRGYQYGIGYEKTIGSGKLKFEGQFSYTLARNRNTFINETVYDNTKEIDVNGTTVYQDYNHLESPIGAYSQFVQFEPGGSINLGDPMTTTVNANNEFKIWSLGLGGSYQVYKSSTLRLNTVASLGINYISEMSHHYQFKLEKDTKVLNQLSGSVVELSTLNKLYPSVKLGTELGKDFGPLSMGLLTTYSRSLASIRDVDPLTKVKTQISTIEASVILGWKF
jgi:hypothetical protein